jgi:hypothetical protein
MIVKHEKVKRLIKDYLMFMKKKENSKEISDWIKLISHTWIRTPYFKKILKELKSEGIKNTELVIFDKRSGNYKLRDGVKAQSRI